ncbi:hypothetical protein, partial [uncultured Rikenella sp.]|uniref:hypothetical protein n=1 Tax=uncultured Rikenella sp. TaxID=368003 RepID=UPI002711D9DD
ERKRSRSEADTGRRIGASLGLCLFWAGKPATVFPLRWAEHEAWIWAVSWAMLLAVLWAELLRLFEPRSSPPPHAADCNSTELVAFTADGEQLKRDEWIVL